MTTSESNVKINQNNSKPNVFREKPGLPMIGLLVLQMILGFEWFWSGLAKIMMPGGFPAALPDALGEMIQNSPAWYANFLNGIVIPNSMIFGYLIEFSEFLIGVVFLFGPLIWFFAWDRVPDFVRSGLLSLTAAAAIGGFFMAVNFHIAMGNAQPWILPTSGLDESVDLDSMVAAMQLVIMTVNLVALSYLRQKKTQTIGIPTQVRQPEYAFVEVTHKD